MGLHVEPTLSVPMFPRSIGECAAAPTPASKFKVPLLNVEMLSALLPAWRAALTVVNLSIGSIPREGPERDHERQKIHPGGY